MLSNTDIKLGLLVSLWLGWFGGSHANVLELWVSPTGQDSHTGSAQQPLRSLAEAWQRIPSGTLSQGYSIHLLPGLYPEDTLPNYLENKHGSAQYPITIDAPQGAVVLAGDLNVYDVWHLHIKGLTIRPEPAGDAFHCEKCQYLYLQDSILDGGDGAWETFKANQSQHIYLNHNILSGAGDNVIDLVAVQYSEIMHNTLSDAQDWCMYAKGGSAYLDIHDNTISNCGTGGITAGQGTGLQYMVAPWLHYEAYNIRIWNNIIRNTQGAGLGVNGGYRILLANNTLVQVGKRSHTLEFVYGVRSCDSEMGNPERLGCSRNLALGAWGNVRAGDSDIPTYIPNREVYVLNNIVVNTADYREEYHQWFSIAEPRQQTDTPNHIRADQDLYIQGNVFFDARSDTPLGIEDSLACTKSNISCNRAQLLQDNQFGVNPRLDTQYRAQNPLPRAISWPVWPNTPN